MTTTQSPSQTQLDIDTREPFAAEPAFDPSATNATAASVEPAPLAPATQAAPARRTRKPKPAPGAEIFEHASALNKANEEALRATAAAAAPAAAHPPQQAVNEPMWEIRKAEEPKKTEEPTKTEEKKAKKWASDIKTAQTGLTTLESLDEQIRFASFLMERRMVSDTFQNAAQVVLGIQYAKALKLEPIVALRMMYVLNGVPTLFGDGPLSLCWRSKLLTSVEEFWIDDHGERISFERKNLKARPYGAVCRVMRRDDAIVQEDYFTLDDLKLAGMDQGKNGKKVVWQKYERLMMRYKARTPALKSKCTDLLNGIAIAEYDFDFTPDVPEIGPTLNKGSEAAQLAEGQMKDLNAFIDNQGKEAVKTGVANG